ncbi:MAG: alpha/beta hydrolase [Bacteroidota bacterium]
MKKLFKIFLGLTGVPGIIFLLMFFLTTGDYHIPKTVLDDATIPHVTIDGVTFHTQTFGNPKNPVVIVVHGGPGWDYKSLLPLQNLSDEFYVVFYDQRGTGLSPRVEQETLTLESYLQDLNAIINYYAMDKKVSLIGHSWGAMLVSAYIGKHPKKVSHAVLAEPGFLTTEMVKEAGISFGPKLDLGFLFFASKVWFQSLHIKSPDEYASPDYFLGQVAPQANPEYYCNGVVPKVGVEHWRASSASMQNVIQLIMNSDGNVAVDLIKGVDQFTDKILFIATECNIKIGVEHQKKQMEFFPNTELAVIKKSGHMMFGERPTESLRIVREYLSR